MAPPKRREFTVAQAAVIAEVSNDVIRQWIARGRIRRNACNAIDGDTFLTYLDERKPDEEEDDT